MLATSIPISNPSHFSISILYDIRAMYTLLGFIIEIELYIVKKIFFNRIDNNRKILNEQIKVLVLELLYKRTESELLIVF